MELFYYRRLDVYKDAKLLAIAVNEILKRFPHEERFALTSQLQRASTSVMFNIAEGFGRYGIKERIHFLDIANGSLMETSSQIELAAEYHYITAEEQCALDNQILSIVKQLAGLRKSLLQSG
ncbi:MAG: four helix bundle protein [Prevotella sp.]|nr:four helix bundle protein [Prevotella sp.]